MEYITKAKCGDEYAKTVLIENNAPLVKSIVKRYLNKGVEYDDLYQLGCLGFLKAINNFDEAFNVKFSTYAVPMIAGEIKRFLRDDGSIKVSRAIKGLYFQMQKVFDERKINNLPSPTIAELAEIFKIDEQEVVFTLESARMPISLQQQFDGSSGLEVIDRVVNEDELDVTDSIFVKDLLETLNEKDKKIIILRYFRDKTQSEVAQMLGVSQVQVSRIESRILGKLKQKAK
jgi:RNA polymerase sporulation-specific sigma factor